MKQIGGAASLKSRFNAASNAIEARFANRPWWVRFLVFAPALILFTALLMVVLYLLSFALVAIQAAILHH